MNVEIDSWVKSLKPETGKIYGRYVRRLLHGEDPAAVVEAIKTEAKTNTFDTYTKFTSEANGFTQRGRHIATYAFRRFLYDHGVQILPPVRIGTPDRVKETVDLTWKEALAICNAAGRPYNLVLKLMLHAGWGAREFLYFNTSQHWDNIKKALENKDAEYVKVKFVGRKKNKREFYGLLSRDLLEEILDTLGRDHVPIQATHGYAMENGHRTHKTEGIPLDLAHAESARIYLEQAFNTAFKRAPISVSGKPTVHELRDTFRTQFTIARSSPEVAEFLMGHTVDPLGYDKVHRDEKFVWENLQKVYGPGPARIEEVSEENKRLANLIEAYEANAKELSEMNKRRDTEIEKLRRQVEDFDSTIKIFEKLTNRKVAVGEKESGERRKKHR